MAYGSGKYTYEAADWVAQYPRGWQPVEVNGLCIDAQDRVFAFNTGEYPVTVFDTDGSLVSMWPEESFTHNHHGCIGPDGSVYCADDGNHTVTKCTPEGKVLMTLGTKDQPSDTGYTLISEDGKPLNVMEAITTTKRSGPPFNAPTGVALSASGEIYVADGYGNARIHKFSPEGELLLSWGEPGNGPGQFVVPHGIAIDKQGRVLVTDRHNNRLQVFDSDGKYLTEWGDMTLPTDVYIDDDQTVYVSDLVPRISIYDIEGNLLAQWGNEGTSEEDPLMVTLHSIRVDSKGDIYVANVMGMQAGTPFFETRKTRMVQKFTRAG